MCLCYLTNKIKTNDTSWVLVERYDYIHKENNLCLGLYPLTF